MMLKTATNRSATRNIRRGFIVVTVTQKYLTPKRIVSSTETVADIDTIIESLKNRAEGV